MNAIILAYDGRVSLLHRIFGKPEEVEKPKPAETKQEEVLTPGLFKAMFSKAIH